MHFASDASGYEHRRTIGFNEEISTRDNVDIRKGAVTYVFMRTNEHAAYGAVGSNRPVDSEAAADSMDIDQEDEWGQPRVVSWEEVKAVE